MQKIAYNITRVKMGYRTREINFIRDKKNHIVRAYAELGKNNSSYFDALAVSYGAKNLAKIVSTLGLDKMKVSKVVDENNFSKQVAIKMANQLFGDDFVEMDLFSSNCVNVDGAIKQQIYVCLAKKNKVDRKRKFDFETLQKYIDQNDILLIDVKEREISPTMALILQNIDEEEYNQQIVSLILKSMPTIATLGKKQTPIVMQQLKQDNPVLYAKIVELEKSVAKNLFVYETSKEQLLLNQAIEEFETNLFDMPIETIKQNKDGINQFKTKAEKIERLMNSNDVVLKKLIGADANFGKEKSF